MEQWRKKDSHNVIVEAVRLNEENVAEVAVWTGGWVVEEIDPQHPEEKQPGINVTTPRGVKRASLHDYVVRFGNQFFVAKVRVFEEKYEPVNRTSPPPESAGDTRQRLGFADPFGPSGRHGL